MKIQTFSIVAGSTACNAHCPYCVSKMTAENNVGLCEPEVCWGNFDIACDLARLSGTTTALITGKGEPLLFPVQITRFLKAMRRQFPLVEIQTNGVAIADDPQKFIPVLTEWHRLRLRLFAISIAHYEPEKNREIFLPHRKSYIDLPALIRFLRGLGFSVRLSCVMLKEFIDSPRELARLVAFAKEHRVKQLTVRPVNTPERNRNDTVSRWVRAHTLSFWQKLRIRYFVARNGKKLMPLAHGACVYDLFGQNLCLTNSLTLKPKSDELRQLIFFPDGNLRYDWQYEGAILL